jgi:SAM-dependent methyltransferase
VRLNSKRVAKPTRSRNMIAVAAEAIYPFDTPSSATAVPEHQADEIGIWQKLRSSRHDAPEGDRVSDDYRSSHCGLGYGEHYNKTHESGYYGALWAKVEKPLVLEVLGPMGGVGRKCLDFACGTGRISNIAAECFSEVVGVDVSQSMLDCARVPPNVRLLHVDLTVGPLDETFDVATAFRFFLNAEDQLRIEALKAIHRQLNDSGRLVCNVHMNSTSPVGVACRLINWLLGRTIRNTLSTTRFEQLLTSSGFIAETVIPYGYLPRPGRLSPRVCEALILPVENASKALGFPGRLAQHFLVVARKR